MASEKQINKSKHTAKPTQAFLRLSEIKQDTLIMKDGTLRAIIAVSSTNFDLKSQEEQDALIYNYQRFVNALEFPIQILMQSRRMDITDYLENMRHLMDKQTNELLRMQTSEYIEFIDRLVESANVMNKNFYVIIPYAMSVKPTATGFFSKIFGTGAVKQAEEQTKNFDKYRLLLEDRVTSIVSTLASVGLRAIRLNTDQIIELMYNSYNFSAGPAIDASQLDNVTITEPENT